MLKTHKAALLAAVCLLAAAFVLGPSLAADTDSAERKDRILANLRLAYPQLEKMNLTMNTITSSGFDGLDRGSFTVNGKQSQDFFVTTDDTKLFLLTGQPIDVSLTQEQIAAKIADRKAAEASQAGERRAELEAAIAGQPVRGNPDGPVTIIEFSDFQCPYCTKGATTVEQILEKYGDDVKFVFKHFPLGFHPWAKPAAIASHCAAQQDHEAFWTLHDNYFKNQKQINPGNVLAKSKEYLDGADIDMAAWTACAEDTDSPEYKAAAAAVDADMALGQKHGVSGTPGFFVNGHFLSGAQPLAKFEPLIAQAKQDADS